MGQANRGNHKTDIVIVGWNHTDETDRCLESICGNTPGGTYHVIYVDNGSNESLEEITNFWEQQTDVLLPHNTGYCHGNNVGLVLSLLSDSEYVLLLNNDTWIPDGDSTWLERLIEVMDDPSVGAVGAVSDKVLGKQVRPLNYVGTGVTTTPALIGFCLLLRKTAIEQVGLLDERFDIDGNWSDFDYSIRLTKAGWKLAIAESVFIHHAGSVTQRDLDYDANLLKNAAKLTDKWGRDTLVTMGLAI
jgi:GT2 family glycosyltransferase